MLSNVQPLEKTVGRSDGNLILRISFWNQETLKLCWSKRHIQTTRSLIARISIHISK